MAAYSVIGPDGRAYGPADEATLFEWAREGRLTAQTLVRCDTSGAHMPAQHVPGLAPHLGLPPHMVNALIHQRTPPAGPGPAGALPYAHPQGYVLVAPDAHMLTAFSTPLTVFLHYITFGIFSWIHFGLMHDRMPRLRQDDPSAVKAICFMLIPFFNLYWVFFANLRLVDRVNEQRRFAGLPPSELKGLLITSLVLMFVPLIGYVSILILMPIFHGCVRASVNELVYASRRPAYA